MRSNPGYLLKSFLPYKLSQGNKKLQGHAYSKFFLFFLFQEYHAEIDKLKSELQSARDKDGVFLPKDHYEEQIKAKEWADKEIHEKGLLLKALEEELQKFKVGHFLSCSKSHFSASNLEPVLKSSQNGFV